MESIVIKKSLDLGLGSFGGSTGVEYKYNFEDVDNNKAENAKIMQRSHGLPNFIYIVHTRPDRDFS